MTTWKRIGSVAAIALTAAGCELTEVVVAEGEDIPVVEAVIEAEAPIQRVLLHRSRGGTPAEGSQVALLVDGERFPFAPGALDECLRQRSEASADDQLLAVGCFIREDARPVVGAGATIALEVETAEGERLHGATMAPHAFHLRAPETSLRHGEAARCTMRAGARFELVWSRSVEAASYLARLEVRGLAQALPDLDVEIPEILRLTGLAISDSDTTLVLPSEFGVLQAGQLPLPLLLAVRDGLPPGVEAHLTIAAVDQNFVNAVRGGTFNPSGQVRVPSVFGDGTGVFGATIPLRLRIDVVAEPEGGEVLRCDDGARQ